MTRARLILLDSDIVAIRCAAAGEVRYMMEDDEGNREPVIVPDSVPALYSRIDNNVAGLKQRLRAERIIACLSCPREENFRREVWPDYKANRDGAVPPLQTAIAKLYLEVTWESYRRPRLEADDVMGILATAPWLMCGFQKIIVSADKDMQTIPGWLLNPDRDTAPRKIGKPDADRFHILQTLHGDAVDGYPGAPGVGPKKAAAFLDEFGHENWPALVEIYRRAMSRKAPSSASIPEAHKYALTMARLARILRAADYDFDARQPILWSPAASRGYSDWLASHGIA